MTTPEALRIRLAEPPESDAVAKVWLSARHAVVPDIPAPVHADDDVRVHFSETVMPAGGVWVARYGPTIVAMMVLVEGWIDQLYVDPDHQGLGVGSALVDWAKTQSPEHIELWTFETNTGARRFYERHGFVAVDRTDGDNEEGTPDIKYRWRPAGP